MIKLNTIQCAHVSGGITEEIIKLVGEQVEKGDIPCLPTPYKDYLVYYGSLFTLVGGTMLLIADRIGCKA